MLSGKAEIYESRAVGKGDDGLCRLAVARDDDEGVILDPDCFNSVIAELFFSVVDSILRAPSEMCLPENQISPYSKSSMAVLSFSISWMCPSRESKRITEGIGLFTEAALSGPTVTLTTVMLEDRRMPGDTTLLL